MEADIDCHKLTWSNFTSQNSKTHALFRLCFMEGTTGQKWNWINLYQTAWCIISYHVVTYPAKQQTSRWTDLPYPIHRVIVSDMPLHRTVCCYIVPGAAKLSSMWAIECKSSHKIVPYVAISPSVCYIVSGVPRYANNHATTSGMHYIVPYAAISYAVKIKGLTGQRLSLKRRETALCQHSV